ncbi:MAG: TlyA family RNA methyltransferase [Spirochaetia bacterium]|jgi:23S rRNA (cytidine1920-2'-O)/16S rRNA (cytidine1409-2'-O)-methyltransferase|nr:TlyA family RNA methyltransferase [Spirochaetia bacterium]
MKKLTLLELLVKTYKDIPKNISYSKIMCGEIFLNGEKITNPGTKVSVDSVIEFIEKGFVSRGGLKLEAALKKWEVDITGRIIIDAGSSTGGFTDCLLQKGADHVYAVDVGYNQLAFSLRQDERVSVFEKTNIMHLKKFTSIPDAAVADLSFRSISGAGRHIINLTSGKWLIALIKPQFEIDKDIIPDFNGIINNKIVLKNVLNIVLEKISKDKLFVDKVMLSPIKGRKGNTEFLFLIRDNLSKNADPEWIYKIGQEITDLIDTISWGRSLQ